MTHFVPIVTFLAGFAGGAAVGDVVRHFLRRRTEHARTAMSTILGLAILMLVGYTAYSSQAANDVLVQVAQCQAVRNAEFERGLAARAASSQAANDADVRFLDTTDRFLTVIGNPAATQAEKASSFAEWQQAVKDKRAAIDDINRAREANPIVPRTSCGP